MSTWSGSGGNGGWMDVDRLRAVRESERVYDGARLDRDVTDRAQVCVVGTGAGGASVASMLARRGHSVVLVEEGGYHLGSELGPTAAGGALDRSPRHRPHHVRGTAVGLRLGCCVGGTTVIGAGTYERPSDDLLDAWAVDHGVAELDATTLRPYFDRLASDLAIAPVPDATYGRNAELLEQGARNTGYSGARVMRGAPGCLGSGACFDGCPQDAKQAMSVSYVPLAIASGAALYTRARVTELLVSQGRAFGVAAELTDHAGRPTGHRLRVVAERVVIACGALATPSLLRSSDLGRSSPHLGRHLRLHPSARVLARFPGEVRGWAGVPEGYAVRSLEGQGISIRSQFPWPHEIAPAVAGFGEVHKEMLSRIVRLGAFVASIREEASGAVAAGRRGARRLRYRLGEADRRRLLRAIGVTAELAFAGGAEEVYPPLRSMPRLASPDEARSLADARTPLRDFHLDGWHPIGTARMADDPGSGVTDAVGRVHGVRDLYVADASVLPASTGPNPQLTVMALALRTADRLAAGLGAPL